MAGKSLTLVDEVDIDAIDAAGFNDFTVEGVFFSHYPHRQSEMQTAVYKIRWPNVPGLGRMYETPEGWEVHDPSFDRSARRLSTKLEAVRRAVALAWDPEDD